MSIGTIGGRNDRGPNGGRIMDDRGTERGRMIDGTMDGTVKNDAATVFNIKKYKMLFL